MARVRSDAGCGNRFALCGFERIARQDRKAIDWFFHREVAREKLRAVLG